MKNLERQWEQLREQSEAWPSVSVCSSTAIDTLGRIRSRCVLYLGASSAASSSSPLPSPPSEENQHPKRVNFRGAHKIRNTEPCVIKSATVAASSSSNAGANAQSYSSSGANNNSNNNNNNNNNNGTPPSACICFHDNVELRAEAAIIIEGLHFFSQVIVSGPGPVFFINCFFSEQPVADLCRAIVRSGTASSSRGMRKAAAASTAASRVATASTHVVNVPPQTATAVTLTSSEATTMRSGRWSESIAESVRDVTTDGNMDGAEEDAAPGFNFPTLGSKEAAAGGGGGNGGGGGGAGGGGAVISRMSAANSLRRQAMRSMGAGGTINKAPVSMAACDSYSMSAIDVSEGTVCFLSQCDIYGGCSGSGVVCRDQCVVVVQDCSFTDASINWAAIELHDEASLQLNYTTIVDVFGCGVMCLDKSKAEVSASEIRGCGMTGIVAMGKSTVELKNTGIDCSGSGTNISVSGAATCSLTACSIGALMPSGTAQLEQLVAAVSEVGADNRLHVLAQLLRADVATLRALQSAQSEVTLKPSAVFSSQSVVVVDCGTFHASGCEFLCVSHVCSAVDANFSVDHHNNTISTSNSGSFHFGHESSSSSSVPPVPSIVVAGLLQRYYRSRHALGTFLSETRLEAVELLDLHPSLPSRADLDSTSNVGASYQHRSVDWVSVIDIPTCSLTDGSFQQQQSGSETSTAQLRRQLAEEHVALKGSLLALGAHPTFVFANAAVHVVARDMATVHLSSNTFSLKTTPTAAATGTATTTLVTSSNADDASSSSSPPPLNACVAVLVDLLPFNSCPLHLKTEEDLQPQYYGRGALTVTRLPTSWCTLKSGLNVMRYEPVTVAASASEGITPSPEEQSHSSHMQDNTYGLVLGVPTQQMTPGLFPNAHEQDTGLVDWHAAVDSCAKTCEEAWRRIELRWQQRDSASPSVEEGGGGGGIEYIQSSESSASPMLLSGDVRNVGNVFVDVVDPTTDLLTSNPLRVSATLERLALDTHLSVPMTTYTACTALSVASASYHFGGEGGGDPPSGKLTHPNTPDSKPFSPEYSSKPGFLDNSGRPMRQDMQVFFLNDEDAPPMRTSSMLQDTDAPTRASAVVFLPPDQLEDRSSPKANKTSSPPATSTPTATTPPLPPPPPTTTTTTTMTTSNNNIVNDNTNSSNNNNNNNNAWINPANLNHPPPQASLSDVLGPMLESCVAYPQTGGALHRDSDSSDYESMEFAEPVKIRPTGCRASSDSPLAPSRNSESTAPSHSESTATPSPFSTSENRDPRPRADTLSITQPVTSQASDMSAPSPLETHIGPAQDSAMSSEAAELAPQQEGGTGGLMLPPVASLGGNTPSVLINASTGAPAGSALPALSLSLPDAWGGGELGSAGQLPNMSAPTLPSSHSRQTTGARVAAPPISPPRAKAKTPSCSSSSSCEGNHGMVGTAVSVSSTSEPFDASRVTTTTAPAATDAEVREEESRDPEPVSDAVIEEQVEDEAQAAEEKAASATTQDDDAPPSLRIENSVQVPKTISAVTESPPLTTNNTAVTAMSPHYRQPPFEATPPPEGSQQSKMAQLQEELRELRHIVLSRMGSAELPASTKTTSGSREDCSADDDKDPSGTDGDVSVGAQTKVFASLNAVSTVNKESDTFLSPVVEEPEAKPTSSSPSPSPSLSSACPEPPVVEDSYVARINADQLLVAPSDSSSSAGRGPIESPPISEKLPAPAKAPKKDAESQATARAPPPSARIAASNNNSHSSNSKGNHAAGIPMPKEAPVTGESRARLRRPHSAVSAIAEATLTTPNPPTLSAAKSSDFGKTSGERKPSNAADTRIAQDEVSTRRWRREVLLQLLHTYKTGSAAGSRAATPQNGRGPPTPRSVQEHTPTARSSHNRPAAVSRAALGHLVDGAPSTHLHPMPSAVGADEGGSDPSPTHSGSRSRYDEQPPQLPIPAPEDAIASSPPSQTLSSSSKDNLFRRQPSYVLKRGGASPVCNSPQYYVSADRRSHTAPRGPPGARLYDRYQRDRDARAAWEGVLATAAEQERSRSRLSPKHQEEQIYRLYTQPRMRAAHREQHQEEISRVHTQRIYGCTFNPVINQNRSPGSGARRPSSAAATAGAPRTTPRLPPATGDAERPHTSPVRPGRERKQRGSSAKQRSDSRDGQVSRWAADPPPPSAQGGLAPSDVPTHPYDWWANTSTSSQNASQTRLPPSLGASRSAAGEGAPAPPTVARRSNSGSGKGGIRLRMVLTSKPATPETE